MATNNCVDVPLSGNTGTGNFVGANTPTLITPNIGVATATSLVFSPTTNGIIGTTTNDNAVAGTVGEFISAQVTSASPGSFSNGVIKDITSISLTKGDWDVYGNVGSTYSVGGIQLAGWVSSTSVTAPDASLVSEQNLATGTLSICVLATMPRRFSLSTTTTIFLSAVSSFASGTSSAYGFIGARRVR